jgi:hypothetical protein
MVIDALVRANGQAIVSIADIADMGAMILTAPEI